MKKIITYLCLVSMLATNASATQRKAAVMATTTQAQEIPAGDTLTVNAPTASAASINLPHGTTPTSPVDGDCWTTTAGLSCHIGGSNVGPYFSGSTDTPLFAPSPNYVGSASDSKVIVVSGTSASPVNSAGPASVVEKVSTAPAFNAFAGLAVKKSVSANARTTAIYGEASDPVGGVTSFVEGGRFQGTLIGGIEGSAYGAICAAGSGGTASQIQYLVGCEGNVLDPGPADAPTYLNFDKNKFRAAFVATNGAAGGTWVKADAGYVVNPYSSAPFQTGVLVAKDSVADTAFAVGVGASMNNGIDLHKGSFVSSALWIPINTAIRAGDGGANILYVDASTTLRLGHDAPQTAVESNILQIKEVVATGVAPTNNTGSCTSLSAVAGGSSAGAWAMTGACPQGTSIKLVFPTAAPNGWVCDAQDMTTTAVTVRQTSYGPNNCVFTILQANTAPGDVMTFKAVGF